MNNEKIAKYIQNIFHLENMTADDDSYNRGTLHSDSWGNGITIRWVIRDFGDEKDVNIKYVYSMGSHNIIIDSGMTAKEASKEIVDLIGRVLITQADTVDPNTGMNNILSWPYNCNLAYVQYVIEALQYGDNPIENSKKSIKSSKDIVKITCYGKVEELPREEALAKYREGVFACDGCERERYESIVEGLEAGLTSVDDDWKWVRTVYSLGQSKKPIKSDSDWHARHDYQNKEIYREAFASLVKDSDAQDFDNSPYGTVHYPGFYRVLVDGTYETEFSAETDEEAIQKFKDYFAETREIRNSRNPIKSSFDVLYDYIDKGVFWEDVEDYADQLIQEGEFTLDEYNSEKGKLREYFNNKEKKAKKTAWENEGRENGFLNSSRNQLSLDKIFS